MVTLIDEIGALRTQLDGPENGPLALVPTMGALHEGHLSLVRLARMKAERVLVSVFVNPLQFGAGEDLGRYPRTPEADIAMLAELDVDVDYIFAPSAAEMYPDGEAAVTVHAGTLGDQWEGVARPGHFDGVLTVVAKLLNIAAPQYVVLGEKDAQQLALVRRMVRDLDFPVEVLAGPIIRDPDGLALSSRNRHLSGRERESALTLSAALRTAAAAAKEDAATVRSTLAAALTVLANHPEADLQYLAAVDPETFAECAPDAELTKPVRVILAARVGKTRLLDNMVVGGGRPVT